MSGVILKAIKDWCNSKFQSKGEYLTAVPEGYVTTEDLKEFHPGGVKLGVDENGNPGYYKYDESAGADTLVPFKSGGGEQKFKLLYNIAKATGFPRLAFFDITNVKKINIQGTFSSYHIATNYSGTTEAYFALGAKDNQFTSIIIETLRVSNSSTSSKNVNKDIDVESLEGWAFFTCGYKDQSKYNTADLTITCYEQ